MHDGPMFQIWNVSKMGVKTKLKKKFFSNFNTSIKMDTKIHSGIFFNLKKNLVVRGLSKNIWPFIRDRLAIALGDCKS